LLQAAGKQLKAKKMFKHRYVGKFVKRCQVPELCRSRLTDSAKYQGGMSLILLISSFPVVLWSGHSISYRSALLQAAGKRPFGHSQLSVYIDGALRASSSLRYKYIILPYLQKKFELGKKA
jgi:hypothetical protein